MCICSQQAYIHIGIYIYINMGSQGDARNVVGLSRATSFNAAIASRVECSLVSPPKGLGFRGVSRCYYMSSKP